MSIQDGVQAVRDALEADPTLLPVFVAGETLTIQRNVNGRNVLMFVEVTDPCSLGPDRMVLAAWLKQIGVSSYADGRVARQRDSIDRLMKRLAEAERLIREASWRELPYEYEEAANRWLANEGEGAKDERLEPGPADATA